MNLAIIPSTGRPCLNDAVAAISPQVDHVLVLLNHTGGLVWDSDLPNVSVAEDEEWERPLNLSKLWNRGLDWAMCYADDAGAAEWNVAVLNDDAIPQSDWFSRVSREMRARGAAAASTRAARIPYVMNTDPIAVNLFIRMCGWAFIVAGEKGVRVNERLHVWYGDDDADWQSRTLGGTLTLGGSEVPNLYPNGQITPELQERIALDRLEFQGIWGKLPW